MIEFIAADLEINVPNYQLLNIKNWQFIDILFSRMANYCLIVENLNIYIYGSRTTSLLEEMQVGKNRLNKNNIKNLGSFHQPL